MLNILRSVIFLRTTVTFRFKLLCYRNDNLQWHKKRPTLLELSYKTKVEPQLQLIL